MFHSLVFRVGLLSIIKYFKNFKKYTDCATPYWFSPVVLNLERHCLWVRLRQYLETSLVTGRCRGTLLAWMGGSQGCFWMSCDVSDSPTAESSLTSHVSCAAVEGLAASLVGALVCSPNRLSLPHVASLHQAELGFLVMAFKEDNRGSKGWGQRVEEWGSLVMA